MTTKEILHSTDDKLKKAIEAMSRQLMEIRTGRANPSMVEGIHVDYYGTPTMLKQLAAISVPDAHMLMIQPWDPSAIPEIEKSILKSNLGITPSNDGKVLRLAVPQLSKERRQDLIKVVHNMIEDGRISIRTVRRDAKEAIEKLEKDKVVSEDEKFKAIDELQKIIEKNMAKIDEILKNKEREVLEF